jgi:hypothetical protein
VLSQDADVFASFGVWVSVTFTTLLGAINGRPAQ